MTWLYGVTMDNPLAIACPACGAKAGANCLDPNQRSAVSNSLRGRLFLQERKPHQARIDAAKEGRT